MYKWHVRFSGKRLCDFKQILKWVCDFPMIRHPQELCKGEATGRIFSEILLYFLSQFLPFRYIQEKLFRRPNKIGVLSQAKLVLQPAFYFFQVPRKNKYFSTNVNCSKYVHKKTHRTHMVFVVVFF